MHLYRNLRRTTINTLWEHYSQEELPLKALSTQDRLSPFVDTDLETLLRARGIDTLVLAGVHTSGVVLSTVRHTGDLDYRLVVVRDCCADPDAEVNAMLLDIVIPKQAAVVTMGELAGALPGRSS